MNILTSEEENLLNSINESYGRIAKTFSTNFVFENTIEIIEKFIKSNTDFQNLDYDTQKLLLSWSIPEIIVVHYAILLSGINQESNEIEYSKDMMKTIFGEENYSKLHQIANELLKIFEENQLVLKIVLLVVVFEPENDFILRKLKNSNEIIKIRAINFKYMNLLFKFLTTYHDDPENYLKFSRFVQQLRETYNLSYAIRHKFLKS
jgi:effector-binding domain-containing protein